MAGYALVTVVALHHCAFEGLVLQGSNIHKRKLSWSMPMIIFCIVAWDEMTQISRNLTSGLEFEGISLHTRVGILRFR